MAEDEVPGWFGAVGVSVRPRHNTSTTWAAACLGPDREPLRAAPTSDGADSAYATAESGVWLGSVALQYPTQEATDPAVGRAGGRAAFLPAHRDRHTAARCRRGRGHHDPALGHHPCLAWLRRLLGPHVLARRASNEGGYTVWRHVGKVILQMQGTQERSGSEALEALEATVTVLAFRMVFRYHQLAFVAR